MCSGKDTFFIMFVLYLCFFTFGVRERSFMSDTQYIDYGLLGTVQCIFFFSAAHFVLTGSQRSQGRVEEGECVFLLIGGTATPP